MIRPVDPDKLPFVVDSRDRILAGRYRLVTDIGQGAQGKVWLAHDERLDRDVAVKELLIGEEDDESRMVRMSREAQAAASISHPGVTAIHDVFYEGGRPWIVMEYVRGTSLKALIAEQGRLTAERAARIGVQVLEALQEVHAAGIVHRDVKPANILIDGDRCVLTDFGIAAIEGATPITQTGGMLGTPKYMAPERTQPHFESSAHPGLSDLWSLGATLYHAVEGRPPFSDPEWAVVIGRLRDREPVPEPHSAGPLLPVLAGLLRPDPAERMSADEALPLLRRVAEGPAGARPPIEPGRVDQIVFQWSERSLLGIPGHGPVASSLTGDALERWSRLLHHGELVEREEGQTMLGALALGTDRQYGVVLRGTESALHVLVGPADTVNERLAAGLETWPEWDGRELHPLTPEELHERLRRAPSKRPDDRVPALWCAGVTEDPSAHYQDLLTGDDAAVRVQRLLEAVRDRFRGPWTFLLFGRPLVADAEPRLLLTRRPAALAAARRALRDGPDEELVTAWSLLLDPTDLPHVAEPAEFLAEAGPARAWALREHRRLAGFTDLLRRSYRGDAAALAGTTGPCRLIFLAAAGRLPGQLPDDDLIELLAEPPHEAFGFLEELRTGAIARCLTAEGSTLARLAERVRALDPAPAEISKHLGLTKGENLAELGTRYAIAFTLGLDLTRCVTALSRPPGVLTRWLAETADPFPAFAAYLLRTLRVDPAPDPAQRDLLPELALLARRTAADPAAGPRAGLAARDELWGGISRFAYQKPISETGHLLAGWALRSGADDETVRRLLGKVGRFRLAERAYLEAGRALLGSALDLIAASLPGQSGAEQAMFAGTLQASHYLAAEVTAAYAGDQTRQFEAFTVLLQAAGIGEAGSPLRSLALDRRLPEPLRRAATSLVGPGALAEPPHAPANGCFRIRGRAAAFLVGVFVTLVALSMAVLALIGRTPGRAAPGPGPTGAAPWSADPPSVPTGTTRLWTDDLTGSAANWPTGPSQSYVAKVGYLLRASDTAAVASSIAPRHGGPPPSSVLIEATGRILPGSARYGEFGLSCHSTEASRKSPSFFDYFFLVTADGAWAKIIRYWHGSDETGTVVQELSVARLTGGYRPNAWNRLQATCAPQGGSVRLTFWINGVYALTATDGIPLTDGGVGVEVAAWDVPAGSPETRAEFSDFSIARIG